MNNSLHSNSTDIFEEKVDLIKEISNLLERHTGRTTRLIDGYIQQLYDQRGDWIVIEDHYNSKSANDMLLKKVLQRLHNEHSIDQIEIDKMRNAIRITRSSRDGIIEKLMELHNKFNELKEQ